MTEPIVDNASFLDFLKTRAHDTWESRKIPYYLSYVAIDLKKQGVDYRKFTAPFKLAQWLSTNKVPETRLVSHPTQKAKVGLVPESENFDFTASEDGTADLAKIKRGQYRAQALVKFVESLENLPEEVSKDFHIPTNVLVALLRS